MGHEGGERLSFEARVDATIARLSPAESRMAAFFAANKDAVVLSSAVQIAQSARGSDATVVRTAKALGYSGLYEMREDILAELTGAASPARLLSRTLDAAGHAPTEILSHMLDLHLDALAALRRPELAEAFARSIALLAPPRTRHIFGIGPSALIANYAALQFSRIGLPSRDLGVTGVALADALLTLAPGDVVVMIAYSPLYREVEVVLDRAAELDLPVVLISDSLGTELGGRIKEQLFVPRGRSEHLALHGATLVLIEALILGLAAQDALQALEHLDTLGRLRGQIDRAWIKRGAQRRTSADLVSPTHPKHDEGKDG